MAPYATLIDGRVRERQLNMISKAFTALPLEKVASMLAFSVDEAEKGENCVYGQCFSGVYDESACVCD